MTRPTQIHAVPELPRASELSFGEADEARELKPGQLSEVNLGAARRLAEAHYEIAAELSPDSPVRALALRCANHWSRLGRLPHGGLRPSPPPR